MQENDKPEVTPEQEVTKAEPVTPVEPQLADPLGLNNASRMLENPKVKKYMGRMSKVLVGFSLLGCAMMIAAIFAITTLFNMIIPK